MLNVVIFWDGGSMYIAAPAHLFFIVMKIKQRCAGGKTTIMHGIGLLVASLCLALNYFT
jgi:hypothetical protein